MAIILSIVMRGVQALKTKIERRKRLPKVLQLTVVDKLILLLTCASSYHLTGKIVPMIEGRLLDH